MDDFFAHIRIDTNTGQETCQTVQEHCVMCAQYAMEALQGIGLGNMGMLLGTMHDGKMTHAYQTYLWAAAHGENVRRGSVNHTFAAVRYLLERYHTESADGVERLTAELAAYAIGAHHGAFDCTAMNGENGFGHRLNSDSMLYQEHMENFFRLYRSKTELDALFRAAADDISSLGERLSRFDEHTSQDFAFGALARLLLSALIEGDRKDTAIFMRGGNTLPEKSVNWSDCMKSLECYLRLLPHGPNAALADARAFISASCFEEGKQDGHLFRLNVPTGAGKTLSSLRFALAQCVHQKKKRIFFVMPLLSIIDQNVKVLRHALGNTVEILEHHSNVVSPQQAADELDMCELLCESWRAPVVCTTLAQFLETLFSGRTSCIRRFQELCESVIVLDEVQSVPVRMLSQFNLMLNFLTEVCGATVVLCSATQPSVVSMPHPLLPAVDMVPRDPARFAVFRRTTILPPADDPMTMEDIAAWCKAQLKDVDTLAVVCNTRSEAAELFLLLEAGGIPSIHLSAAMCMNHRRNVLARIEDLAPGEKLVCVSTQVFEAGVNVSLQRIGRILAGLDEIVQVAGRCNRHGEAAEQLGQVQILRLKGEKLPAALQTIKDGQSATNFVLDHYRKAPSRFDERLDSDEAIHDYYRMFLGGLKADAMDYPIDHSCTMFDLLSSNERFTSEADGSRYYLHQAFKEAGRRFRVFDEDTTELIAPYGDSVELLAQLRAMDISKSFVDVEHHVRLLRPFTVSVYQQELQKLLAQDAVETIQAAQLGILSLRPAFYDPRIGLTLSPNR